MFETGRKLKVNKNIYNMGEIKEKFSDEPEPVSGSAFLISNLTPTPILTFKRHLFYGEKLKIK